MSFKPVNLTLWSASPLPNVSGYVPQWWGYYADSDSIATVSASAYFNNDLGALLQNTTIRIGDSIYCVCSDGVVELTVTAISPDITTTAEAVAAGSVGTAALVNLAVTTAKINDLAVTNGKIAANAVDTSKLSLDTIQYAQVAMTAAEWNGMYAAPKAILSAPGAGKIIQVDNVWYDMAFVSAQYASGGVVNLQYDSTVNGAGVAATADTAAATVTGLSASSIVAPGLKTGAFAQSTTVNKGLYMSNKTGAFTTGDSTWKINVAYRIITA